MRRLLILSFRACFSPPGGMKDTPTMDHPSWSVQLQGTVGIHATTGVVSLLSLYLPYSCPSSKYLLLRGRRRLIVTPFCFTPSLRLLTTSIGPLLCLSQVSASVPLRHLTRTFIRETALLIKELIFSLLSPISIANLKHCEFFKFSPLLSKREREKKRWEWGDI